MRRWLRSRLTYANVTATLALFLVLSGGTAVALSGSNTVFSDDIVDNEVKTADVRNDTLTGGGLAAADLRPNAVGTSEVVNNSLGDADVLNGSLATTEFASSIPAAHVTHSVSQGIANDNRSTLAFDTERYDTASVHNNATNNSRLTAPVKGIYAVTAQVYWQATPTGRRIVYLTRNANPDPIAVDDTQSSDSGFVGQELTTQVQLAAGDFVQAEVRQTSGGSLNVIGGASFSPEFSMTWLAPGP
jgi:hypothetical protein